MKRILFKLFLCSLMLVTTQAWAQSIRIQGTVTDNQDEGIPGTTVKLKGTKDGTITDVNGEYSILVPSDAKAVLVFSFIGYQTKEVPVNKRTVVNVTLAESSQQIDEVVVVGFGTQKKINVTGAVKTVDTKVLTSRPITNAVSGLQGAVAGLNITNDMGGAPGQKMNINIRGVGSIGTGSNSSILVLIDGMEGDLATINPSDIASVSVLKDAAAASIYGSRAPNGVILVTTKSGEKGISVSYGGNVRIQQPISVPEPVDSYRYAVFFNDARTNSNEGAFYSDDKLKKLLDFQHGVSAPGEEFGVTANTNGTDWISEEESWANTNWYDVHMKKNTISQEHNLSLNGGSDRYNFYVSARYMNQMGLFRYADDQFQHFSFSGNFNFKINKKISFNWNTRFINEDSEKPSALDDLFLHNLGRMYPFAPVKYPNGEYAPNSAIDNLKNGGKINKTNRFLYNQAKLAITPLKGWNINFDISSRLETPNDTRLFRALHRTLPDGTRVDAPVFQGGMLPEMKVRDNGSFSVVPTAGTSFYEKGTGKLNYLNSNLRTDYELKLNKHIIKLMVGAQLEYEHSEKNRLGSPDIISEDIPYIPSDAVTLLGSEKRGTWSTLGFFGRINYNYANRYMLEANLRADGASRFPSNKRWGYFPSFSAGWNVAQEPFFEDLSESWFNMLKIRGSYGSLGNQNTDSYYPYFQKIAVEKQTYIIDGKQISAICAPKPFSTDISWEKIETIDLGLDLSFLHNRLSMNFDFYQRKTRDMIGPSKSLPVIFGAPTPQINNAELRTRGWELEFAWRDRIGKDWSYEVSGSLSDMKQIVTRFDNSTGQLKEFYPGKDLGEIWGLQVIGIAKSDEEMEKHIALHDQSQVGTYWGGGDFMYRNLDNDPQITEGKTREEPGDLSVIGNKTPRYAYGIRGNLTWKFLDFSMFWQGIGKRDFYFNSTTFYGVEYDWGRSIFKEHMDYFRYADHPFGANLDSYYARPRTAGGNNNRPNDHYLQDASYLRLKNVTVGISLPKNTKLSKYVQNMRLYVSAENLFTFTNLMIFDPEAVGSEESGWGPGKTYPMYRTVSVGFNITL